MDKYCELCGRNDTKILGHHLSYEPEIIVGLCTKHHSAIHAIALLDKEKRAIAESWIVQFGDNWVNGAEKYYKSEARKEKVRKCRTKGYYYAYYHNPKNKNRLVANQKRFRERHKEELNKKYREWYYDPKNYEKVKAKMAYRNKLKYAIKQNLLVG